MAPLEPWEKVLVDMDLLAEDVHGSISCVECHGGTTSADFEEAHDGLIPDPADEEHQVCGQCHSDIQASASESLHTTLAGYDHALYERSIPENHPVLEEMEANHCNSCHTTCGDCHISQPDSVGGGLLEGHQVVLTPPMTRTCTACHGSRVKDEYTGRNEGYPADVHFANRMNCVACHTGDELHGIGVEAAHRYDGARTPQCESCHAGVVGEDSDIPEHSIHGMDTMSCQVCHSVAYKNCSSCHVQQNEEGVPYYTIDPSWMEFRIALNEEPSEERPWKWVVVRHVPIDTESFAYYGDDLLINFDERPTWIEATPHNIQLSTPQTESCDSCHGNADIFLTEDAVLPAELEANGSIIVQEVPATP